MHASLLSSDRILLSFFSFFPSIIFISYYYDYVNIYNKAI